MSGGDAPQRVLVVEDDADIATLLADVLEAEGYLTVALSDARELEGALETRPDLLILDLRLPRGSAEQILGTVHARGMQDVPVLLLSAAGDLPDRARALGVEAYLAKPFELEDLLVAVRSLI